jgi:CheY-like chemotaxis protein
MKTVMLIDDSEADLLYSRIVVGRSGLCDDVLEFDSAQSALAHLGAAAGHDVDMILLDINMPGMDGFQFLQAYQELRGTNHAHAIVVMLTSSPDPRDRRQAEAFNCVRGYIVKPINLDSVRTLHGLLYDSAAPNE